MINIKSLIIGKNDANQRLDKFISKAIPRLPPALMYKYIRTKRIKLGNARVNISTKLCKGDVLNCYINDEFFEELPPKYDFLSSPAKLNIVYEDNNILLVDKPQGLIVHPDDKEYRDTLIGRIQHYLYNSGEYDPKNEYSFKPALANRIDRNTGGIVIAAKNAESLRVLCEKIKLHEIDKKYLAVTHGIPAKPSDNLTDYLKKDERLNRVFLKKSISDETKTAMLHYDTLATINKFALLEVTLLTGRTHQIRAQLAGVGHPLLGDGKYGKISAEKQNGFTHQALYSYKLTFSFKTDGGILDYLNDKTFKVANVWFVDEIFKNAKY